MTPTQTRLHPSLRSLITTLLLALPVPAIAQVQPIADDTLGNERSLVSPNTTINGIPSNQINGGAQRGANLFHSFREFNIDTGRGAYFTNPAGVANIITRVTGGDRSNILGILGVLGNANLFLINPNGILFGPTARLDVNGSFIASTANSVAFNNNFAFSAADPQAPPLLTVNIPIGLQYGSNPGAIETQGADLQVPDGQTLTLAGGNLTVNGGRLFAPGGRVELAGVAAPGLVGLRQQGQEWRLSVPDELTRGDVAIANDASVNVRAGGGGSIAMTARNLTIAGAETTVRAGIEAGLGTIGTQVGDINLNASEVINIDASVIISNAVLEGGIGNAGDINLLADSLVFSGGIIVASTQGEGDTGDINIVTDNSVSFGTLGGAAVSQVLPGATGKGGNVSITTRSLSLSTDALVSTLTASQGNAGHLIIETGILRIADGALVLAYTADAGNGGDIEVRAQSVEVVGFDQRTAFPSFLAAQVVPGSTGSGGNVTIETGSLRITEGGSVGTGTFSVGNSGDLTVRAQSVEVSGFNPADGSSSFLTTQTTPGATGNGGDLTIETGSLRITNGGIVGAGTFGAGNSGDLTVRAQSVEVSGFNPTDNRPSVLTTQTEEDSSGSAGNILLTTDRLSIANRGEIRTTSLGSGSAGNITVQANSQIILTNSASINSNTNARQANLTLNTPLLLLRRNSNITTNASGDATGGDILINSDFIASTPNENSDVTANAFNGRGGTVTINAIELYWFTSRSRVDLERLLNTTDPTQLDPRLLPTNDITAVSQGNPNLSGSVTLNTPDLDSSRDLVQLPVDLTDASRLIAQTCPTGGAIATQNEFIITGRGGLPPTPNEAVDRDAIQVDLVTTDAEENPSVSQNPDQNRSSLASETPIVEAQELQVAADGRVMLVVALPEPTFNTASQRTADLPNSLATCQR